MTTFHVIETGGNRPSVCAIDDADHLIAGAYLHQTYWRFYFSEWWALAIGVPFRPDPVHLMTKDQALHWVEMLAAAYCRASEREAA